VQPRPESRSARGIIAAKGYAMLKHLTALLASSLGIPIRADDWEWWELAFAVVLAIAVWAIFGD
jgi:hypothetical protein